MSPESLGFDPQRLATARALLERAVDERVFPGAVVLIARHGQVAAHWAIGHAQSGPPEASRPMLPDTVFDLASLTKAVAGATAALVLLEDGAWSLDDPVARFVPEFGARGKQEITIRQLLSHSAGFTGWVCLYAHARDPEAALVHVCDLEPGYAPGTDVQYSDVGFGVLGHLVRRVSGEALDRLLQRRVWEPLGMRDTGYTPSPEQRARCAATERGNRYERAMVANLGESFDGWRDHVLVGEVHDGNTAYALGGVSSHAGLFSTALDLFRFGEALLGRGPRVLSVATIAEATSDQTRGLAKSRGLGWELLRKGRQPREEWAASAAAQQTFPAQRYAFAGLRPYGDLLSGRTFGHTGFAGTSLAIDPERDLTIILLTNRVHPDADNFAIGEVRPRFHNLVAASLVDT